MKTLPIKMLRDAATLIIPEAVTGWHDVDGAREVPLSRVHVQRLASLDVTGGYSGEMADRPAAELWFDCRVSAPRNLAWMDLQAEAVQVGAFMEIIHKGVRYRVHTVEELPNTLGGIHHYRLELFYA